MEGPFETGGVRWWLREGSRPAEILPLLERVAAAHQRGALVDRKQGRRKGLYGLALARPPGDEGAPPFDHLLKESRHDGLAAWRRRVTGSKARRELARAEALAARGLPTPVPLAAGERVRSGQLERCWLLMPLVAGALDLRGWWEGPLPAPSERRAVARQLGELARQALRAGLFQDDFAPNNVLLRQAGGIELWMIDFERARVLPAVSVRRSRRMLAKLEREMAGATRSDRMRFLEGFAGENARGWWRILEAEAPRLLARDVAHVERTLRRGGRHFERREAEGGWRGWVRRGSASAPPEPRFDAESRSPVARAPADELLGLRELGPQGTGAARAVLARAVALARRRLGPPPLALWQRPDRTCLVWDLQVRPHAPAYASRAQRLAARRALLRRLLGVCELEGEFEPGAMGWVVREGEAPRPCWLAPERVRVHGRATPPAAAQVLLERR